MSAVPAVPAVPPTLHVKPRVDSATVYKDKSRLRRCAPLSFDGAVDEVQVMVPMPGGRGLQSSFDRDSIQVEFGAAYDGKVILAGVLVDEVDERCLRGDGTVDLDAARVPPVADAMSVSDEDGEAGVAAAAAKTSAEARREVERQLADVRLKLRLNDIALEEATAARDYSVDMAERSVASEDGARVATAAVMFNADMWAAQLDAVEAAKREFARVRRELAHERDALEKEQTVLQGKLSGFGGAPRDPDAEDCKLVNVAVLTLKVLEAVPAGPEAVVYVSYMIWRGQWSAAYEAHLDTTTNEVVLYYNAEVVMSGGEDLHDVALTLSSAAPRRNAALPPSMSIWRCGVVQPEPPRSFADEKRDTSCGFGFGAANPSQMRQLVPEASAMPLPPAPMVTRMNAVVEAVGTGGVVNFAIPTPQTVLANGKTTRVPLTELRMPATISYVSVPEKMAAAFTHAKIKNTSDFLLLRGEVAVFLDGNYVTRSSIGEECAAGGMVELDFGVDRTVEVKRVLLRQANRKVQSSYLKGTKNNVRTYAYRITLRNKKRAAGGDGGVVRVKLIEHIPMSSEEPLRVRLLSPAKPQEDVCIFDDADDRKEQLERKARLLENEGVVEIEREVAAGQSVEVMFSFEVESPSGSTVYGL